MPVNPAPLIARADKALERLDGSTLARIRKALELAEGRLEARLAKLYAQALKDASGVPSATPALAEQRARQLVEEIRGYLQVFDQKPLFAQFEDHITQVTEMETEAAQQMLTAYGVDAPIAQTTINTEAIKAVAQNSVARLARHGQEFALTAESVIIQGIAQGRSFRNVARDLRAATGVAMSRASTIVRTETINASDTARRETYKENGIEYVQRVATQDTRVCEFCAARAGNVYPADEAPAVIHPNDRCYNAPFKFEWLEAGVIDTQWFEQHRKDVQARSLEGVNEGAAPFERMNGLPAPKAVWKPGDPVPAPKSIKPPEIIDVTKLPPVGQFKTMAEAKAWVSVNHPQITLDFSDKSSIKHVNSVLKQFDRHAKEWPDIAGQVQYIGDGNDDTNENARFVRQFFANFSNRDAGALAHPNGRMIGYNRRFMNDEEESQRVFIENMIHEFLVIDHSTDLVGNFTTHEFGHLVDFYYTRQNRVFTQLSMGTAFLPGNVQSDPQHILKDWFEQNKPTRQDLSEYGLSDEPGEYAEAFAESFNLMVALELTTARQTEYYGKFKKLLETLKSMPTYSQSDAMHIEDFGFPADKREAAKDERNEVRRKFGL